MAQVSRLASVKGSEVAQGAQLASKSFISIPGCREAAQQEKRMLEQQLLETAGDVARAERRLTGSHVSSLASNRSSSMEYSSDEDGSAGSAQHPSHQGDLSAREIEALRVENEAIMKVWHKCVGLAASGHS